MPLICWLTCVWWMLVFQVSNVFCESNCSVVPLDDKAELQCGTGGSAIRCTGFYSVPEEYPAENVSTPICLLDLSENHISTLKNGSFFHKTNLNVSNILWLYLHFNTLTHIEAGAFEGLDQLVYLNISSNNLTWRESFAPGVFRPLLSLINLNMKNNIFLKCHGLDEELAVLDKLVGLWINPTSENCTFGPQFETLQNFTKLSLSGVEEGECIMNNVNNDTFKYLTQLQFLFMVNCNISTIEAYALKPLKKLEELDVSYNIYLNFSTLNMALVGLRNTSALQVLRANRIISPFGVGIALKEKYFENIRTLRGLRALHMDLNKIEVLDKEIFTKQMLPEKLRTFTLTGNRLSYADYTHYIYLAVNLTVVDISRQYLYYDPFFQQDDRDDGYWPSLNNYLPNYALSHERTHSKRRATHIEVVGANFQVYHEHRYFDQGNVSILCDCKNISLNIVCVPQKVKHIFWRKSLLNFKIPPMVICNAASVEEVDLSLNLLTSWIGPVYGLNRLKRLDLSLNLCTNVSGEFLLFFPNLEWLDISKNSLWISLDPDVYPNVSRLFSTQTKLEYLDMSYNKLYTLPENIFTPTSNLKTLKVSRNYLDSWNSNLTSPGFEHLDLRQNNLRYLPSFLYDFLDERADEHNVTLLLGYNKIDCSNCSNVPFFEWVVNTKVDIRFEKPDTCVVTHTPQNMTSKEDIAKILPLLRTKCKKDSKPPIPWLVGIRCAIVGCIFTAVIGITIYKKRWTLRYIYYTRTRRYTYEGFERLFRSMYMYLTLRAKRSLLLTR